MTIAALQPNGYQPKSGYKARGVEHQSELTPMAVDATPSPTANSYISNADAVAVWQADPYKQDYPTDVAVQDRILINATQLLDDIYGTQYVGTIYDKTYSLYWPRTGVVDQRTGDLITDYTSYPADLGRAVALQAYYINQSNRQAEVHTDVSGVKRERVEGAVEVEYFAPTEQRQASYVSVIHSEVERIMSQFISGGSSSAFTTVMRRG